jgi:hypothetical protein
MRDLKRLRLVVSVLSLAAVLGTAETAKAFPIAWTSFDSWVRDETSGSVPFKSGTLVVDIQPDTGLTVDGNTSQPFATSSPAYSNIDSISYASLFIAPDASTTGNPWSVEFDLVGATLASGDAFNVGQLFVSSVRGPLTELTISMFAPDDTTPFPLTDLLFEQHARAVSGFGVPLIWDASTGVLRVSAPVSASENSQYAFFSPAAGEIGKIVVSAMTIPSANGDTIEFAFAGQVPEPGTGLLLITGMLGLALRRRPSV